MRYQILLIFLLFSLFTSCSESTKKSVEKDEDVVQEQDAVVETIPDADYTEKPEAAMPDKDDAIELESVPDEPVDKPVVDEDEEIPVENEPDEITLPDEDEDEIDLTERCEEKVCDKGFYCEVVDNTATCLPYSCDMLECTELEECAETEKGGHYCRSIACSSDLDCPLSKYCDVICLDDTCEAGAQRCDGESVKTCLPNGSKEEVTQVCGSDTAFGSVCTMENETAFCSCEGDWDCPEYTKCEAGKCTGSGSEPTCFIDALPMKEVLPTNEITWGSDFENPAPDDIPYSRLSLVLSVPMVANLTDDNGDGLINELDIPEIIFLACCNNTWHDGGVLRAIHGGGADKGKDYFATTGDITWHEGDPIPVENDCSLGSLNGYGTIAVGDLDYDGVPEIVALTGDKKIDIYSNTGDLISRMEVTTGITVQEPAISIANIDNKGLAEIIINAMIFTLEKDDEGVLKVLDKFEGDITVGHQGYGAISCVANLVGDENLELVAGGTLYRMPQKPSYAKKRADCTGAEVDEEKDYCDGKLVVEWTSAKDGFCAVADVLGADREAAPSPANPLDGKPEIIIVQRGDIVVYAPEDGTVLREIDLGEGTDGGAPNVDDFDGDGFPEVASAFATAYVVYDFQEPTEGCPAWPEKLVDDQEDLSTNPARTFNSISCTQDSDCGDLTQFVCNKNTGQCVCLHNGWKKLTEDDSSRITGSSVFDFNGDGAAEVIYNDECYFRMYNGIDGSVLLKKPSESPTATEYPVVADVDNDGNAEIVFATSMGTQRCSERDNLYPDEEGVPMKELYNNGIEVWGDQNDIWVSARRIWNQHSYHVTNINEDGSIPLFEVGNWLTYNGRVYNTYRSNPRNYGVAPDFEVVGAQVTSPDLSCGELSTEIDISIQVENKGDASGGRGTVLTFSGKWDAEKKEEVLTDRFGNPLETIVDKNLEPLRPLFVYAKYFAESNTTGRLPDSIIITMDAENRERECIEDNNSLEIVVEAGEQKADLAVSVTKQSLECPELTVKTIISNKGSKAAEKFHLKYYQGDPDQGGSMIQDEYISGKIELGAEIELSHTIEMPTNRSVEIHVVVDTENEVDECDDGNNSAFLSEKVFCVSIDER